MVTLMMQAGNTGAGPVDAGRRTTVDFLRILWERKLIVVAVVVACVGASLVVSLTSEKEYTAESSLLLRDPGFARTLFGSDLFEGGVDPERVTSTKIAVIESPAVSERVENAVSERFPGTDVAGAAEVTPNENSDVVTIAATADDPRRPRPSPTLRQRVHRLPARARPREGASRPAAGPARTSTPCRPRTPRRGRVSRTA